MIHTRKTIFKTLQKRIRELTKHANPAPKEFKKILLAVILNDLKEWSEYIPKDNPFVIDEMLVELLRDNCFIIERVPDINQSSYVNVNTPQTNNTWQRIWDRKSSKTGIPVKVENQESSTWEPDPNCEVKLVYFYPDNKTSVEYLTETYGEHGEKLKTICDKMNAFINRETNEGYYLTTDCRWEKIGNKAEDGMTQSEVEALLTDYHINHAWIPTEDGVKIESTLVKGTAQNQINLLTENDVEDMIYGD